VKHLFVTIVLLITLLLSTSSFALVEDVPFEEMIARADLIIIGKLEGKLGQREIDLKEQDPSLPTDQKWYTDWKVTVLSYLKGDSEGEEITVITPGVKVDRGIQLSTDYSLDEVLQQFQSEFGIQEEVSEILLFLEQVDGFYQPITPKAIVPLKDGNLYIPLEPEAAELEAETQNDIEILNNLLEFTPRYSPDGELQYAGKMHWIYYVAGVFLLFLTILNIWLYSKNRKAKQR
jgi:hypothetical protein